MAGHSHWSSIKHKKAVADARRGKLFSKLAKNIMVAARTGGGNPADNLKLRYAIETARAEFMPKDSIEKAIKKGTGELEGGQLEELTYEGIGPGGISIILEVLTDNRNRTGGEIRNLIDKRGGSLGKSGSVSWKFDRLGILELSTDTIAEDELFEIAIEAGADNLETIDDRYQITTTPESLEKVRQAIEKAIETTNPKQEKAWGEETDETPLFLRQELCWISKDVIPLEGDKVKTVLGLMELLEDHEDIQNVWSDFSIPDDALPDDLEE